MSEHKALIVAFDNSDKNFFKDHPDRQAHIRLPWSNEASGEFYSLGDHNRARRRILLWRVPADSPYYDRDKQPLIKIPFLAFADETIEDTDEVLLPLIHTIMTEARQKMRM